MLLKALLLGLEFSRVPSELPTFSFDAGGMLAECILFRFDARHTPPLVFEQRPKQRRRGVERVSNLIECAQWVARAMRAVLE